MKTRFLGALAAGLLAAPLAAQAASVTFNYTTDNILTIWGQCAGASCVSPAGPPNAPGPNGSNWQLADSLTVNLAPGDYYFAFFAQNLGTGSAGNPAAFLAEILLGSSSIPTSSLWDVTSCPTADPNSCNFSGWTAATQYGTNGGANIWTNVKGGPIAGISSAAHWIWSDRNFNANMDPYVAFRVGFSVVPEPGTLALLGLGLAGLGLSRRRKAS